MAPASCHGRPERHCRKSGDGADRHCSESGGQAELASGGNMLRFEKSGERAGRRDIPPAGRTRGRGIVTGRPLGSGPLSSGLVDLR